MVSKQQKIFFFFKDVSITLEKRTALKGFIQNIYRMGKKKIKSLNIIFCSDNYLLKINKLYLNHNYYTDIITFDLSESNSVIGEIYISVERVKENAKKLHVSLKSELHRVIFHGVLHLCGYMDKTNKQTAIMREQENYYLLKYLNNEPPPKSPKIQNATKAPNLQIPQKINL